MYYTGSKFITAVLKTIFNQDWLGLQPGAFVNKIYVILINSCDIRHHGHIMQTHTKMGVRCPRCVTHVILHSMGGSRSNTIPNKGINTNQIYNTFVCSKQVIFYHIGRMHEL
jgi:hypothetical protein